MSFKVLIQICTFLLVYLFSGFNTLTSQEFNRTHFRGSNLNGISETDKIPLKWDDPSIKWKTEIHGRGHSSPVVYGNQIWITTATADGKELYAVCVDYQTGPANWEESIHHSR